MSAVDLQRVKEWIASEAKLPMEVHVEDPETVKGGLLAKSYLTYRILSKQVGRDLVGVRHRYSEFETVRKQLKDRYAQMGILVPQLPPKKMMGSTSQESCFVKERTQGLTLFCEGIASNPFLRNDAAWRDFIRPASTPYDSGADNTGEVMLYSALNLLEQPFKFTMATRMDAVKDEIKVVEKQIENMVTTLRRLQEKEKDYLSALEGVSSGFQAWGETETQKVKALGGFPFDCSESIVQTRNACSTTLENVYSLNVNKFTSRCFTPDYSGALVIATLEGELSRMEAFRELLKQHEEMIAAMTSIGVRLEKASSGKTKDSVPDLTKQLEMKQAEIATFYKGFVYFTLPMCSRMRSQTLRQASLYMAALQLAEASALRSSSLRFLKEMDCHPTQLVQDSSKKLELLSMKPFDQSAIEFGDLTGFLQAPPPPPILHGLFDAAVSGNYAPLFAPVPAAAVGKTDGDAAAKSASGQFSDDDSDGVGDGTNNASSVFAAASSTGV